MNVTEIIIKLRNEYVSKGFAPNFYEINNGLCDDFSMDCLKLLGGYDVANTQYELENGNFMIGILGDTYENDIWDSKLLEEKWGITPTFGLSWDDLNEIDFGIHVWLYHKGLHYDAECSQGVSNFFDLPLFKRYILSYKGMDNFVEYV